ncbi:MAG: GTPase ObgE [Candidatus Harrisonbacteria bacterium CG10_big_fil_rev_8_21_14_0_10_42_17]|uniref:GTPase Obg n=1 Tax=Candidatus Harrisonbacteria bacterium CG10_big_fil_rev_8_21_14_0_10_42_17 TaxID=1974584 RepID=A0A2M6WGY6_9BACT|nr:MAG: GTPase ObgE [Candidatus Harrisonbacteria bacterium CG10_big_fil_rev_8_21_14_0_10_42_17]
MFIDDVTINIAAGHGGKGSVAFNKNKMSLGPTGGSGGKGGSVFVEGVSDLGALRQFRHKKTFTAENGRDGRPQFKDGHDGEDLILLAPVGTVIHNLTTHIDSEITHVRERLVLAKGGIGGKGNFLFRSSTNTTPKQSQPGLPGEAFILHFELKLIADVGFIGLPNVGKSSLLNELTNATSRVANYQFTTLEPHLGAYYELVLADIPGLIEGSSSGKGLGIKFLKHIERTRILFHLISAESEDPRSDYEIIRNELAIHSKSLTRKKEYLFLTKSDMVSSDEVKKKLMILKKLNRTALVISIHDEEALKKVQKLLNDIQDSKTLS